MKTIRLTAMLSIALTMGLVAMDTAQASSITRKGRHIDAPFSAAVGRSGNVTAYGPWDAQVSPDGTRIAYWRGAIRAGSRTES